MSYGKAQQKREVKTMKNNKHKNPFLLISVALLIIGLAAGFIFGGFNMGFEFSEGTVLSIQFEETVELAQVQKAAKEIDAKLYRVQKIDADKTEQGTAVLVSMPKQSSDKAAALADKLDEQYTLIGQAKISASHASVSLAHFLKGMWKMTIAVVIGLVYMQIRFRAGFATGAIVFHNVLLSLALICLVRIPVTSGTIQIIICMVFLTFILQTYVFNVCKKDIGLEEAANAAVTGAWKMVLVVIALGLLFIAIIGMFGGCESRSLAFAAAVCLLVCGYASLKLTMPLWGLFNSKKKKAD